MGFIGPFGQETKGLHGLLLQTNQLEKLEAARTAYLRLTILTFSHLSLPLLTFPYLPSGSWALT